ncbi:hypothetical protein [Kitasatospora sp. NPDC057541]|uniref:hypothetical protein n=1 Tax=Kitasatospora sp. NPDC057541 TaxID=3346161 RepID=UPI003689A383
MDDRLWRGVRERAQESARASAAVPESPFGAIGHRFRIDPVPSPAGLVGLEAQIGVRRPRKYRLFLPTVGAGGAGPACGVSPVRREDGRWPWAGGGAEEEERACH